MGISLLYETNEQNQTYPKTDNAGVGDFPFFGTMQTVSAIPRSPLFFADEKERSKVCQTN